MTRRVAIKWMHWLSLALILYFWLVEPEDVERLGAVAVATHSGFGTIFAVIVAVWVAWFLWRGLAGRPGPKLKGFARKLHSPMHQGLYWLILAIAVSGGLIALFAPFAVLAFGVVQIMPNFDIGTLHNIAEELHEIVFDAALILIVLHALYHIWRHYFLRDNALRIMVPKSLHKYL